jgi:hypothetical protein
MSVGEPLRWVAAASVLALAACTGSTGVTSDAATRAGTDRSADSAPAETTSTAGTRPRPTTTAERRTATTTTTTTTTTMASTTTTTQAAVAATTTTAPPPDPGCDLAIDIVTSAGAVRSLGSATEQLDAIGATVDRAKPSLPAAGESTRELVERLVGGLDEMRNVGVGGGSWGGAPRGEGGGIGTPPL